MADSFNKKTVKQKKAKKKLEKQERREERKSNNNKGKSLADMTVYLDEFGNFTDVPVHAQKRTTINAEDIQISISHPTEPSFFTGKLSAFNTEKGFGFITEDTSNESVFVHQNSMAESLKENDRVTYEKERTPKGMAAINVKKIN